MTNSNYKKDLKDIRKAFDMLQIDSDDSSDIRKIKLDVVKDIHKTALKAGIKNEDIQYLIDYYNLEINKVSDLEKEEGKEFDEFREKFDSIFSDLPKYNAESSEKFQAELEECISRVDKVLAVLEKEE